MDIVGNMFFTKSKKIVITSFVIMAIAGYFIYQWHQRQNKRLEYETVQVERGNLTQTVEATGKVESVQDLELHFETAGVLAVMTVKEGDDIKAGDLLAQLRLNELKAAVAQARANLNQKLAGATAEDIRYYQAAVDAAKAALDQARVDAAGAVASAESAVETARNNLRQAEVGGASSIVADEYEDAVALLRGALHVLDDGLIQADNILGVDNVLANDSFESVLSSLNSVKLNMAISAYAAAKTAHAAARDGILSLATTSPEISIDAVLRATEEVLTKIDSLLSLVNEALNATPPAGGFTQATLDAKKTIIQTARAAVTAKRTSIVGQKQSIADSRNSLESHNIIYQKALRDLGTARANAINTVAAKEAAYSQARASLDGKTARPREVDVAAYRVALTQAIVNRDKAILKAPIDGVVAKVHKSVGELVTLADIAIEILSPHYEVNVDIPETDIPKIMSKDSAVITLDAFGDEVKFNGKIISIEPASTEIQDVVYYKVKITLDAVNRPIKPGMTANVAIVTESRENALFIPARSVRSDNGRRFVRVLENRSNKEVDVRLGIRTDDGRVEILSGLEKGEEVILSARK